MPGLVTTPDVLAVAMDYLANRPEVQAVLGNPARISDELPAGETLPAAVGTEATETQATDPHWLYAFGLQFDVWADSTTQARSIADLLRGALHDDDPASGFAGRQLAAPEGCVVTAVGAGLALRPFRDPDTKTPRYQVGVTVYAHPVPA